jgi:hypothetical protein
VSFDQTPAKPLLARQQAPASEAQRTEDRKRFERDVDALARLVDKYRVDGQRFFAGDLKLPPDELREHIAGELRRLQNSKLSASADAFRLGALEGRFNSHLELFGRRLRERELGTAVRRDERPEPRHDPAQGVLMSHDGAVEALFKGLYDHAAAARSGMDLERFRGHLRQQAEAIRAQTGCSDIQFRIAEENGKKKIKARPIKAAQA